MIDYSDEKVLMTILNGVINPHFRVWKVETEGGAFRSNDKKINSIKKLREFLDCSPVKVYVSVAQFLNPHKVFGLVPKKAEDVIANSLFLKSDLMFDFDSEQDLAVAHEDAKKVVKFMLNRPEYRLLNIRFSGSKGFHVNYADLNPVQEEHPWVRLKRTEFRRRNLVNQLPPLKTIDEVHKKIVADQFRVQAAIGTVKASTGKMVTEIPLKDFMSLSTKKLLKRYAGSSVRRLPMIRHEDVHPTSIQGKERPGLISYPFTYQFITNMVAGTRTNYVTVLKYPINKKVEPTILKLQKRFLLSHFYKIEYDTYQLWLNMQTVSYERLLKIMRAANAGNLRSFQFFKHSWIPVSPAIGADGKEVFGSPKLEKVLLSAFGEAMPHSRPHAHLFKIADYKVLVGRTKNQVCLAKVGERWTYGKKEKR